MFTSRLSSFDNFFKCYEAIGNIAWKDTKKMKKNLKTYSVKCYRNIWMVP